MNKINLLLSFLCLPLLVVAQGVFPLVSPSGKMNADIKVGGEECRNRFICQ